MRSGLNIINTKKSTGSETITRYSQQPSTCLLRDGFYVTLVQIDAIARHSQHTSAYLIRDFVSVILVQIDIMIKKSDL